MRATRTQTAKARGFTLIELIVVMTLLTAAVSLSAPRLANFFKGRTLDSEGRRVLTMIRYAQDLSVSKGVNVRLWIDGPNNKFGIEPDTTTSAISAPRTVSNNSPIEGAYTFDVDQGLKIRALNATTSTRVEGYRGAGLPQRLNTGNAGKTRLPTITCLPDGTFQTDSPEAIELADSENFKITISQSRNRLGYEIVAQ